MLLLDCYLARNRYTRLYGYCDISKRQEGVKKRITVRVFVRGENGVVIRRGLRDAGKPGEQRSRSVVTREMRRADIVEHRRCGIARGRPAAVKLPRGRTPNRSERGIGKNAGNGRNSELAEKDKID